VRAGARMVRRGGGVASDGAVVGASGWAGCGLWAVFRGEKREKENGLGRALTGKRGKGRWAGGL
jgi:hypothetical protein